MALNKIVGVLAITLASGCAGAASVTQDAGPTCVDNVLCIRGSHFDSQQCKCVPNVDAGSTCVQNVLCVIGDHFDTTLCKCVPN